MRFDTPLKQHSSLKKSNRKLWDDPSLDPRSLRYSGSLRLRLCVLLFFAFCLLTCLVFSFLLLKMSHERQKEEFLVGSQQARKIAADPKSNEPRVALCLTGGLRAFELTAPPLKFYLLNAYRNTDVFVITPKDNDTHKLWLLSGTHVVSVTVVDQPEFPLDDVLYRVIANHSSSSGRDGLMQYASLVERCCSAIERYEVIHRFKYDWVIRTRPDGLWFNFPPPLTRFSAVKFHVPEGNDWYGVNDRFSIANRDMSLDTMRWVSTLPQHYQMGQFALTAEPKLWFLLSNLNLSNDTSRVSFSFCVLTNHTFRYPLIWHNDTRLSSAVAPLDALGDGNGRYCKPCVPEKGVPLSEPELTYKFGTNLVCNGSHPSWPSNWRQMYDKAMGERFADARKSYESKANFWTCVHHLDQFFINIIHIEGEKDVYKLCYSGFQHAKANLSDPVVSYVMVDV